MAHMALYRKWRPLSFDDVVEQHHIVDTLKNSIKSDSVSHAYLFCGTRGTGKTTLAKIFSRAVNCRNPIDGNPCNACEICKGILDGSVIDVIEIDAASNNGVDDVRQIKDAVMYVPAVARFKVYIIDEVHMLSSGAFNALLKTLEEPPGSVIFILATTEPHKLPATILSRCQRYDFRRISLSGLSQRLKKITDDAGIQADDAALSLISRLARGGMRDAISLLDQSMTSGVSHLTREAVISVAGLAASDKVNALASALIDRDANRALSLLNDAVLEGYDLVPLCGQLIEWFRNLMLVKTGGDALRLIEWSDEELSVVRQSAVKATLEETVYFIRELSEAESRLKWAENQRILTEVTLLRLCGRNASGSAGDERIALLEARLSEMEKRLAGWKPDDSLAEDKGAARPKPVPKAVTQSTEAPDPSIRHESSKAPVLQAGPAVRDWPDVIEYVQKSGRMKVYVYLMDTTCILQDDDTAIVLVSGEDGLKKTVLSRSDSIEIITEGLFKVMGRRFKVKVKDEKEFGKAAPPADEDPVLEKVRHFAETNHIRLDIQE